MLHGRYTVSSIKKHHDGSSVIELAHTPPAAPGPDDEIQPGQRRYDPNRPPPPALQGRFDMHVSEAEAGSYKVGQVYELGLGKDGEFSRDPRFADTRTDAQRRDDGDDDRTDVSDTRSDAQKRADEKAANKART
jgi:hypothetical protein